MPYQNLDSEIMLAVAIWLLAIIVFIMMFLAVCAKLISEKWTKGEHGSMDKFQSVEDLSSQNKEKVPTKETELQSPV